MSTIKVQKKTASLNTTIMYALVKSDETGATLKFYEVVNYR